MLNVSSLATRNNRFITLPGNGTILDASERAKLLKNVEVRFEDIHEGAPTRQLAVVSYDGSSAYGVRKSRKRLPYE